MPSAFDLLDKTIQRALWDMRWSNLRPLQVDAIQAMAEGVDHLILSAATASGKTEAAFLPVLSAIASNPDSSVRALYVGPLKALINDQFGRLESLCEHAHIPVHRWHGDVSAGQKQKFRKDPGGVLLITPESLESCFINYGNQVPRIFRDLDFVVIDELHAFIGDPRGHHLRSLLYRLDSALNRRLQFLGLSATLGDFSQAQRYIDRRAPDTVRVIEDEEGQRAVKIGIRAYPWKPFSDEGEGNDAPPAVGSTADAAARISAIAAGSGHLVADAPCTPGNETAPADALEEFLLARELAKVFGGRPNLVFTNSRVLGEVVADQINQIARRERWPTNPFVLHHGSLSKDVRTDVERRLKAGDPLTVLCTSTLEMGIDIGSVYSVGQLGPTWSVASLVQRLGRSGRGKGESAILRLYSLDEPPHEGSRVDDLLCPQLLRSIALVELMVDKWLEPVDECELNLSTLIHQVLSVLRQTGGAAASQVHGLLCDSGYFAAVPQKLFAKVLRSLGAHDLVEQMADGTLILTPDGESITHSRDFYANFIGTDDYAVRFAENEIGKLPASSIPPPGEHLILNGRRWRVDEIVEQSRVVEVLPASGRKRPLFKGEPGEVHAEIARRIKRVLESEQAYPMLHEDAAGLLDAARSLYKSCGLNHSGVIDKGQRCQFFPWTGSRGIRTRLMCARADGISASANKLSITYSCSGDDLAQHLSRVGGGLFEPLELARLIDQKKIEKYDCYLPEDVLDQVNSTRLISVEDAAAAANAS